METKMETGVKRSIVLVILLIVASIVSACNGTTKSPGTTVQDDLDLPGWELVWQDDFTANELDGSNWTRCKRGTPNWQDTMSDDPRLLKIEDGVLHLLGIVNDNQDEDPAPYLSAGITSRGKYTFKYGNCSGQC